MSLVPLILLVLAVAVGAAAGLRLFVVARHGRHDTTLKQDAEAVRLGELLERRRRLLEDIRVAGLDLETGKMTAEDHRRVVRRLEREVADVLRALDALRGGEEDRQAAEALVEAHLRRARSEREAGDATWSRAATLRHGGTVPQGETP